MGSFALRDYQRAAVDATRSYWAEGKGVAPVIAMPTGSGKSAVLSHLALGEVAQGRRAFVLTHRAQLLRQSQAVIEAMDPTCRTTLYGASLGERDLTGDIVLAMRDSLGIQVTNANLPEGVSADLLIIDEAHLVPPGGVSSRYGALIEALRARNEDLRLVGLTATPYRLGQGYLWDGKDAIFDGMSYEAHLVPLIQAGYLVPPKLVKGSGGEDLSRVQKSSGEYSTSGQDAVLEEAADGIADRIVEAFRREGRRKLMVFAPGVSGAKLLRDLLTERGVDCTWVFGDTPENIREAIFESFRDVDSGLEGLVSCDVLTTGFDSPSLDCLALVRATASPSLYVQIVGRGLRPFEGKDSCTVMDFGANVERHGPLDGVEPRAKGEREKDKLKACKECGGYNRLAALTCVHCEAEFPREQRVRKVSSVEGSREFIGGMHRYRVLSFNWRRWVSKHDKPDSLLLEMWVDMPSEEGMYPRYCEVYAGGHDARYPIRKWFGVKSNWWPETLAKLRKPAFRGEPVTDDIEALLSEGLDGAWRTPEAVTIEAPAERGGFVNVKRIGWRD